MGAFFTNVQLKISGLGKAEICNDVIEYITRFNAEAGFVKTDSEEDSDKTVIVLYSGHSDWLSIYDEETEGQSSGKLNKLTSGLSKEFKTAALSVLVNDSDSMYVGLSINGTLKDALSNLSKEIDFSKKKPGVWAEILTPGLSFENIKTAWQTRVVFVEDFLARFSEFINLDSSKILTGYEYISEERPSEGIRVHFARKDKKKPAALGLTEFKLFAGAGLVDVKKDEKQTLEWIMTNHGASSNGLEVVIAGECIEKGLLIPESVQTSYVKSQPGKQDEYTAAFVETVATTGEKIFYARIEEIHIPKGFKPDYPMSPKEGKQYRKISYDCAIKFNICFIGGKDGAGDLAIFFAPLANRQEGSYFASVRKGTLEEWMKNSGL